MCGFGKREDVIGGTVLLCSIGSVQASASAKHWNDPPDYMASHPLHSNLCKNLKSHRGSYSNVEWIELSQHWL